MTDTSTLQSPFTGPWVEAGVRKVLLPARRTGTLALSQDGRLAVAVSNLTSLLLPSSIGPSVAAYNGEKKPEGTVLRDRGLAQIHALYPAVIDHELVSQFAGRSNARLLTSSRSANYVPSSEDVQAVAWSPRSRGPVLLIADGSGGLHLMSQRSDSRPAMGGHDGGLFAPSQWTHVAASGSGNADSFPKSVTCAGFTSLRVRRGDLDTAFDVLLAIGSKTALTLWSWPLGVKTPKFAVNVRNGWITCLAWQATRFNIPQHDELESAPVAYLACGMSGVVCVYKVTCRHSSCSGDAPDLMVNLVWSSDPLPVIPISCLSWWRGQVGNSSQLRLACGVGNGVCMMRWLLQDDGIASHPDLYSSVGGHKRLVSSTGFLVSGEFLSSSLDGSVILWHSLTESPPKEPSAQPDAQCFGPSAMDSSSAVGDMVARLQGDSSRTLPVGFVPMQWRPLVPHLEVRASSLDQPVFAMSVTGLGLAVIVLCTVPATGDDYDDDVAEDSAMRQKFRSSARLSRVALYVPTMRGTSMVGNERVVREFLSTVLTILLTNGEAGHAFTIWDLELWIERMDSATRPVALVELMRLTRLLEVDEFGNYSNLSRMRASRSISSFMRTAVDPSSQGDLAAEAEILHSRMTQSILVEYCAASLDRALTLYRSISAQNGSQHSCHTDEHDIASSMKILFDDDETLCMQAMCAYIFGYNEENVLCDSGGAGALKTAQDMLRVLARFASSDGTFMCSVCVAPDEPTVLTCASDDSRMTFSCAEGDSFPRCVLTMGPCLSCAPLCCRGCGARASPGIFDGVVPARTADGRESLQQRFAWLAEREHCTLCLCRLEVNAVDPPRFTF